MHFTTIDVAIIGAGPIGIFTIFACGLVDLKTCVIDSSQTIGGQCTTLYPQKNIYDIPGFIKITANELIERLTQQASIFRPRYIVNTLITDIYIDNNIFYLYQKNELVTTSASIILATGAGYSLPNKPDISHLEQFENISVFYHVHNVEQYRNKKVVIVGGGDSALDWAIVLSTIAEKVIIIHRRDIFRAANYTARKIQEMSEIMVYNPYIVKEMYGHNGYLQSITIQHIESQAELKLTVDYVLICCGFHAVTEHAIKIRDQNRCIIPIDMAHGAIAVQTHNYATNIPGIYAVGDAASYHGKRKLILCGFSESITAAHSIYKFINNKIKDTQHSTSMKIFHHE